MNEQIQFGRRLVVRNLAGRPIRHRHQEVLLHTSVESWNQDILNYNVERLFVLFLCFYCQTLQNGHQKEPKNC